MSVQPDFDLLMNGWSSQKDGSLLYIFDLVVSTLSFLSGLVMIYFCFKVQRRSVPIKLVLSIAISDLFYTISNFMSIFETTENGALCHAEAYLREVTLFMSLFMVTCTSIVCYKSATMESLASQETFFKRAVIGGFIACLILSLMPLYNPLLSYQNGITLCYISVNPEHPGDATELAAFLFQAVPIMSSIFLTFIIYGIAIHKIKSLPSVFVKKIARKVYKLLWYPAVLFVTYIPALIDIFLKNEKATGVPTWIPALHMILTHAIGLTNSIVYGIQMKVLNRESDEESAALSHKMTFAKTTDSDSSNLSSLKIESLQDDRVVSLVKEETVIEKAV